SVETGDFFGIYGLSGSGKSTLLRLAAGLAKPSSGQIILRENARVGLVFQFPENQLFGASVIEDVMFGPSNLGLAKDNAKDRAQLALNQVGISEKLFDRSPFFLSGGEKRRVAIAGILAMETDVLMLDEPLAGLDPEGQDDLCDLLQKLNKEDRTIIVVSHESEILGNRCKNAAVLEAGKLKDTGSAKDVFKRNPAFAPVSSRIKSRLACMGIDI
ncbi:MAG: ATP-binding cassette domain-containing protein, partial [Spirochaetales bacterium]|nr:ATP-binding cassette domain-containing protein [Spirochaetales bacterium]